PATERMRALLASGSDAVAVEAAKAILGRLEALNRNGTRLPAAVRQAISQALATECAQSVSLGGGAPTHPPGGQRSAVAPPGANVGHPNRRPEQFQGRMFDRKGVSR